MAWDGSSTPRESRIPLSLKKDTQLFFRRLGVPFHSWRISHAKHHASTGHVSLEQVYVPRTRSEVGLKPFDPNGEEDLNGSRVTDEVKEEFWEAVGESPLATAFKVVSYLVSVRCQTTYVSTKASF